jgi:protein involved in polysaccharide export with SLBB domain
MKKRLPACLIILTSLCSVPSLGQAVLNNGLSDAGAWPQMRLLHPSASSSDPAAISSSDPRVIIKRALSAAHYMVTPGDAYQLDVRMMESLRMSTGSSSAEPIGTITLVVDEDSNIDIPFVGSLDAKSMDFCKLRDLVTEQVKKTLPRASYIGFTLVSPALFDVQVFGETGCPGITTASSLSRVSDVLVQAQGVWLGASLRQIELVRNGQHSLLDLFLYGQKGEIGQNPYVRPGDVLFVPRAALTVLLQGAVMYPGNYEMVLGETLKMLIDYAGGLSSSSPDGTSKILRGNADGSLTEININAGADQGIILLNGDRVWVY